MAEVTQRRYPLLEARGVSKRFGKVQALAEVDFQVDYGEVVGLVGDNGAGKSTLVHVLTGVQAPDSGQLFLEGAPITLASPKDARALGIETVYQDLALVDHLSVARNFFLGRELTCRLGPIALLDLAAMHRVTERVLQQVGITTLRSAEEPVRMLSGGERQAIAIGRAIHFGAKLLILDEPTSALSVRETRKVLDYIVQAKGWGLSVVFITHNLQQVYPVADRVVVLERGRKVGDFPRGAVTLDELTDLISLQGGDPRVG
jgi:simple sugar transport system ATP-binding protein